MILELPLPHLWIPEKPSLITDGALALTMMARYALRRRPKASSGITFINSASSGAVNNGGTPSVTVSGLGMQLGDILIAMCATSGGTNATPTGHTLIHNNSVTTQMLCSYKIQSGSLDTSVSFWDGGGTGDSGGALCLIFRGVDQSTPLDVTAVETTTSVHGPAITPSSNNCALIIIGAHNAEDLSVDEPINQNWATNIQVNGSDNNDVTLTTTWQILVGGGGVEFTPNQWANWGGTGAGNRWGVTIALRPAP